MSIITHPDAMATLVYFVNKHFILSHVRKCDDANVIKEAGWCFQLTRTFVTSCRIVGNPKWAKLFFPACLLLSCESLVWADPDSKWLPYVCYQSYIEVKSGNTVCRCTSQWCSALLASLQINSLFPALSSNVTPQTSSHDPCCWSPLLLTSP